MDETTDSQHARRTQNIWIAIGIFLVVLPVMSRLTSIPLDAPVANSDHPAHLGFAVKLAGDWRECLPHPLYHMALVVFSAGNLVAMPGIAATLLSLMIAVRAFQTIQIVMPSNGIVSLQSETRDRRSSLMMLLLLTVAMPLPNWWKPGIYLGQLSPNVWHNPTTIFCMPIVLALFSSAIRSSQSLQIKQATITGLLFALCALAKPNFPLAFAPCCVLMLMRQLPIQQGIDLKRWYQVVSCGIVMLGPLILLMGVQFVLAFGSGKPESSGIEIAPLKVWRLFTPNIVASTILGLAFPLTVAALYPKQCRLNTHLVWSFLTLSVAILQLILLAEKGPRWSHGNFLWGSLFATTLVYIYSAQVLINAPHDRRRFLCTALLSLHAGSGAWYLWQALGQPAELTVF
jgi:hypothetical protein